MNILPKIRSIFSRNTVLIWTLVAVGVLVYLNCLPNEMFWDDDDFILHNIFIQDWQYWPKFFTNNIISGAHLLSNYWRPLLQIVFAIEWHLWADWVPGWHFVNIIIHSIDAALLFLLLQTIFQNRMLAFLTAAMFLLHPAQSEAIVYPNSLGDPLANLFVFAGLLFFARFRASGRPAPRSPDWWLAMISYPLALMSKETGILLLAYLVLCDWLMRPSDERLGRKILAITRAVWPFIVMAAGYMLLRATVLNFNNSFNFYKGDTILSTDIGVRVMTFLSVLSTYVGLLFVPYDLRVERMIAPSTNFFAPDVLIGAAFLVVLLGLAWRNRTKQPVVTFGILWFFVGIAPTSNLFVLINALVYEHFLYTALIGIWLAVFWMLLEIKGHTLFSKKCVSLFCVVLFVVFAGRIIWRNTDWRTAIGFYEKLLPTAPKSYRVINNLGMEYADNGMLDKAEATYRKAIALDPKNAVAYHNLGNIYRDRARNNGDANAREEAIVLFEKTIALQENFIFSYKSLAQLYIDKGDYPNARRVLEKFFYLSDEKLSTMENLVKLALMEGNLPVARHYLETLLSLRPGDQSTLSQIEEVNKALAGHQKPPAQNAPTKSYAR